MAFSGTLLVIDTALEACAVALVPAAGPAVLRSETIGRGHAELLLPMIAAVLADAGMAIGDVARIAVTTGPGSFTGIRVGVAAARGLALVTGAETVALSTLAAHAEAASAHLAGASVLSVIDGRRGDIHGQLFSAAGVALGAPRAARAGDFALEVGRTGAWLAASGAPAIAAAMAAEGHVGRILHTLSAPDLEALVALARRGTPGAPRPLYLRPADATPMTAAVARAAMPVA